MQQVGTGSRFWWRALDAPSPEPVTFKRPPATNLDLSMWGHQAESRPQRSVNSLEIHKSQRRTRRRRSILAGYAGMITVAVLLMIGTAAAVIVGPNISARKPMAALAEKTTAAMIALGFGIDQVNITGQRYTNDADVFDALDLANVPTFLDFKADETLKRIMRISWVDTAQITRVYPSTLNIEIKERLPSALWSRGDKNYLVDASGRVLGPIPEKNGWVLPRVTGEGANTEIATLLTALGRHKVLAEQFDHGERIAERRWSVVLQNGSRIELGADREVEGLDEVANNRALRQAILDVPAVIDVRTAGRIALRPLQATVAANVPSAGGARP